MRHFLHFVLDHLPMAVPVPYDAFQGFNHANPNDTTPWTVAFDPAENTVVLACTWTRSSPESCIGEVCLHCEIKPPYNTVSAYQRTYRANVTVERSKYDGGTNLAFTWSYWPAFAGSLTQSGKMFPIHSQIGTAGFDDEFPSVDYSTFMLSGHNWNEAAKITHASNTSLLLDPDGVHGYIPITISFSMRSTSTSESLYYGLKGIDLVFPSTTTTSTSSSPTQTSDSTFTSNQASPGTIIGAIIGALAFAALFACVWLFYRRRKRQGQASAKGKSKEPSNSYYFDDGNVKPTPASMPPSAVPWTIPYSPPTPSFVDRPNDTSSITNAVENFPPTEATNKTPTISPTSPQPEVVTSVPSHQDNSRNTYPSVPGPSFDREAPLPPLPLQSVSDAASVTSRGPVPVYGSSLALENWARANRASVSEDMEAKLLAAGYMPGDNPDDYTEEEWKTNFGITRLELLRLRKLYIQDIGRPDQ